MSVYPTFRPSLRSQLLGCSALLSLLLVAGCGKDNQPASNPTTIDFTQAALYPEGVQYDSAGTRFLVSSETRGTIGQVDDSGFYSVFADDPQLISTVGMKLDNIHNQLLVAVSDPGYNPTRTTAATKGKLAAVAIFNRATQKRMAYLDLGALRPNAPGHFANDLTFDPQGNIYVTDSFAPIIYRITPNGTPTVLLENPQLAAPAGMFGLNGIVYHPDGYLLVAKSDEGALFKVPLNAPASFTKVTTSADLKGADGLLLRDNNTLLLSANAQSTVYRFTTADSWASATAAGTFATPPVYPTTLTRRGPDTYVLYSHLNALQANQQPPVVDFTIRKVGF